MPATTIIIAVGQIVPRNYNSLPALNTIVPSYSSVNL
jgi:hypothetical protein